LILIRPIFFLFQVGPEQQECLAACHDQVILQVKLALINISLQINGVSVTSSDFPNRETFVRREEFCLTLLKLKRTCNSKKRIFLEAKFPTVITAISNDLLIHVKVCADLSILEARYPGRKLCVDKKWDLQLNFSNLEEEIFRYAKQNLAVVNVYIKVISKQ